jgi:hypothetical protein
MDFQRMFSNGMFLLLLLLFFPLPVGLSGSNQLHICPYLCTQILKNPPSFLPSSLAHCNCFQLTKP